MGSAALPALFTAPFLFIGTILIVGGFMSLVNHGVPGDSPFTLRAARYLLQQATTPRHWIGALPLAFLLG